jgi:ketosteroid isomerase-like protein
MGSNQAVIDQFKAAVESNDMAAMGKLLAESATDDFRQEYPQSGERIVGREAVAKINEGYAQATGKSPSMKLRRLLGSGDIYVVEGTIDYGDGIPVSYVGIAEFRDGKVAKITEYFANPFEAPAWRANMVERMEPVGV